MLSFTPYRQLAVLLTAQLAWTSALSAFEQSSYFILDLVETETSKPIVGRIAVPVAAITAEASETAPIVTESQGEFEIDFTKVIQPETSSGFELTDPIKDISDQESIDYSTQTFDLGTNSNSVFGN